mgnify:CR=1 FL=1
MAAVVTKVEKEVDEYKEDGLKFTINEHILDDEKDIGYDHQEGNLLGGYWLGAARSVKQGTTASLW